MPSSKEKKRYLNIEIINTKKDNELYVSPNKIMQELTQKINRQLGIYDAAGAGIIPIDYKENKALLRVSAKYQDRVKSTLLFINEIGTQQIILTTKKVSGSINKARTEPRNNRR